MPNSFQHIRPVTYESGNDGPHLLIMAGVHGDEYEPIYAVQQLIDVFKEGSILNAGKLTLVPIVNGPAYKNDSRTAQDGIDLARTCPGNKEGTETEQIAWEISHLIHSADYMVDMHTGGKAYTIYPLAGYLLHPDQKILRVQRAMVQAFGLPVQWGTSPLLNGRTLSVARDFGIPAIYTEYGGGKQRNTAIVEELMEGCLRLMAFLKMIHGQDFKEKKPQYVVEDSRIDSGYLQIMYPSPSEGCFEAYVGLGTLVNKGDPIGQVGDSKSGISTEVIAGEDGLIFLLRSIPKVNQGEATAGIIPITSPGKIMFS